MKEIAELVRIKKLERLSSGYLSFLRTFMPDQGKVRIVFHMGSFEVPGWYFGCQIHNKWYFMDQLKDQQVLNCLDWANPPCSDNKIFLLIIIQGGLNFCSEKIETLGECDTGRHVVVPSWPTCSYLKTKVDPPLTHTAGLHESSEHQLLAISTNKSCMR